MLDVLMRHYGELAKLPTHKLRFHVLKHSIATHLLDASDDVYVVLNETTGDWHKRKSYPRIHTKQHEPNHTNIVHCLFRGVRVSVRGLILLIYTNLVDSDLASSLRFLKALAICSYFKPPTPAVNGT